MKRELLLLGTAPCVSTICLPDVIARDQISQAFSLRICILQAIKYWRWERPGNEASQILFQPYTHGQTLFLSLGAE